jgi:hypothetical protein
MCAFDKPKFFHIVMNDSKTTLQDKLLKVGNAAILLVQDIAMLDDAGNMLPSAEQEDPRVKVIMEVLGL